jgi:hypothetical protein
MKGITTAFPFESFQSAMTVCVIPLMQTTQLSQHVSCNMFVFFGGGGLDFHSDFTNAQLLIFA